MLRLKLDALGVNQLDRTLMGVAGRVGDLRPAWNACHQYLLGAEEALFQSQGATGSKGRWAGYQGEPRYQRIKAWLVPAAPAMVLVWGSKSTSRLWPSLTDPGHPDHHWAADEQSMTFGTRVPWAGRLAQGGPTPYRETAPPRLAIDLSNTDRRALVRLIQRHIMGAGK